MKPHPYGYAIHLSILSSKAAHLVNTNVRWSTNRLHHALECLSCDLGINLTTS